MFDFLSYIPFVGNTLMVVVPFVIVLSIVIFIHEFGHYIVGRWCGIHAEAFSMGFGPVLKRWQDKRGTVWQIAALPLGGYVKFLGDANAASAGVDEAAVAALPPELQDKTFDRASLWKRALTVFAGPAANFLLSLVVFALIAMWLGRPSAELVVGQVQDTPQQEIGLKPGDLIKSLNGVEISKWRDFEDFIDKGAAAQVNIYGIERAGQMLEVPGPFPWLPIVSNVNPATPAAKAGVKKGDLIVSFDGHEIGSFLDLQKIVQSMTERSAQMRVYREGALVDLMITPRQMPFPKKDGSFGEQMMIGVGAGLAIMPDYVSVGPIEALQAGANSVLGLAKMFVRTIIELITGGLALDNLQGPVGIAVASSDSAAQGAPEFVMMIAFISTAIGLMNLLPIPVLDGGHLMLFAYQAVFRRPPNARVMQVLMGVGLSLLLMLMLFATFNDIMRL